MGEKEKMSELQEVLDDIKEEVTTNPVVLYMKGNKLMPQCGFSAQVVHVLNTLNVDYIDRDVLQDEDLRQAIKEYANWPTIPQLYVEGKFVGGCDIVMQMYESGDLEKLIAK